MFLSLQPIGRDHGPHRAQVSPFLAEFLSDLVESQFPQSDGKVLHRSAQNGTGARKEMCRCSDARAEPCQKNTTNITSSEIKFSTVRRKLTLLDMVHGSTFAPFSQPLVRLKHYLAFPFPSLLWSPVSAAGLRATRSSQKHSQNTWKSEEPHVEI